MNKTQIQVYSHLYLASLDTSLSSLLELIFLEITDQQSSLKILNI